MNSGIKYGVGGQIFLGQIFQTNYLYITIFYMFTYFNS